MSLNLVQFIVPNFQPTFEDRATIACLKVPVPENESERIKTLRETKLLDSSNSDEKFDRFTNLASRLFQVPICLISLVDVNRQWFKSKVGIQVDETDRDSAFCTYVVLETSPDVFVVPDARQDCRFKNNPLVLGFPYIRFFAGAALIINEIKIGTLCLIDSEPHFDFDIHKQLNLLDLASIVAQKLNEGERKF